MPILFDFSHLPTRGEDIAVTLLWARPGAAQVASSPPRKEARRSSHGWTSSHPTLPDAGTYELADPQDSQESARIAQGSGHLQAIHHDVNPSKTPAYCENVMNAFIEQGDVERPLASLTSSAADCGVQP